MARVLIVDERRAIAEAIGLRLGFDDEIVDVGVAASFVEYEREVERRRPDVVIVDLEYCDLGTRVLRDLESRPGPAVPTSIVIVPDDAPAVAASALRAGARGVMTRQISPEGLRATVAAVVAGDTIVPPRLLTGVIHELCERRPTEWEERIDRLTVRERDVLGLMVAGYDRGRLAEKLALSVNTIRTHVKHILSKLEVHSSLEAVTVALRAGIRAPADSDAELL